MEKLLCLMLLTFSNSVWAQMLSGRVVDKATGEPLEYATIKVKGKDIGWLSHANGEFEIKLTPSLRIDSIRITYIGYHDRILPLANVDPSRHATIELTPLIQQLEEVNIVAKEETEKLGSTIAGQTYRGWGDYKSLRGRIIGALINGGECPVKAKSFSFRINHNEWDSVRFRVNFYRVQDSELGHSILTQNIFVTTSVRNKWIKVDLTDYNVIVDNELVATLEWVDAWGGAGKFSNRLTISNSKKSGYAFRQDPGQESRKLILEKNVPAMFLEVYKCE